MTCSNCGHSQETGNFCGKCGMKFGDTIGTKDTVLPEQAATSESVQQPIPQTVVSEPNVHVEKIKVHSKMYGSYFVRQLKKPSGSFNQLTTEFTNGLISIILLSALIGLSLFAFTQNFAFGYGPGFLSMFGSIFIFSLIMMGIVTLCLFLISRFFGPQLSYQAIISLYGGHLSPLLLGSAITILLMLLKSYTYGNLLLSLVFMFAIFIMPLYIISALLTKKPSGLDPFYGYMLYILAFAILFFIFITILADSTIGEYIDDLTYFL